MSAAAGRIVEATAPCALRLGPNVAVALDRRAWCRVEPLSSGLEFESKDAAQRIGAADLAALVLDGSLDWVWPLLRGAGVDTGLRISIHGRVPESTGLGVRGALAVALTAALGGSPGRHVPAEQVAQVVVSALPDLDPVGVWAALLGGVVSVPAPGVPGRRVRTDPGKLEERLLLLDVGLEADAFVAPEPDNQQRGDDVVQALERRAFDEVGGLLGAKLADVLASESAPRQAAARAQALGGQAWPCAGGTGGLMAVWIAPDGRRALVEWARSSALGVRPVACRLDLLGLDVERA